ncbi:stage II sporulation protein M [Aeromicrobium sp. CF4.19]|uniref:stage II sporulation protein M n=1 Tax=Aeromicrobium sp. CF4.19 TaxID=3373082 RepID=UPI003EE4A238
MHALQKSLQIIRADLGTYLVVNVFTYGLLIAGMVAGLVLSDPDPTTALDGPAGGVAFSVLDNVVLLALLILVVNGIGVSVLAIVLPSMVVPFLGLPLFGYMMFNIGMQLAPVDETMAWILLPHSPTLLIELQAYVLVILGAVRLGRFWLRPAAAGATTRRQAYGVGLRQLGRLGVPALLLFIIGAVYEAFEIIYLIPLVLPN